jgi:mannose/cellobiose epimerase-like protein (N-acyl-D-glucosamine 2-epimerase family)
MNKDKLITMNRILSAYKDGIFESIERNNGVVGEYFLEKFHPATTRLLCQTRSIYFLSKYYNLYKNDQALSSAEKLYIKSKSFYSTGTGWKDISCAESNTINLYELAFLAYSLTFLYKETGYSNINKDARLVFSLLISMIEREKFFPKMTKYHGFVSQNPLMHLFESFISGYNIFNDEKYLTVARRLLKIVEDNFYKTDCGRLLEVLGINHSDIWSEPGHAFEWGSLLVQASKLNLILNTKMLFTKLIEYAEKNGVNSDGFTLSKQNNKSHSQDLYRIWPQLERVRVLFETKKYDKGYTSLNFILIKFFDNNYYPIEYYGIENKPQKNKITTGYHIINCFEAVIKAKYR